MKGDFTRRTEDPGKHYSSVQMQQGRVQTDADWNEQIAIDEHLRETSLRDVVGRCGAPQRESGFRIDVAAVDSGVFSDGMGREDVPASTITTDTTDTRKATKTKASKAAKAEAQAAGAVARDPGDLVPVSFPETLVLSPGRIYVDGILCELEPQTEVPIGVSFPASNLVTVSPADLHSAGVREGDWVKISSDFQDPDAPGPYAVVEKIFPPDSEQVSQTVRLSIALLSDRGFRNPRLRRATTLTAQPDLPDFTLPAADGTYIAYLHVWRRHLTWLDDPQIRETALGGPDTATRMKTVWQVELLQAGDAAGNDPLGDPVHCLTTPQGWQEKTAPSSGRMRARTQLQQPEDTPCIVPSKAGYTGLENQLYRVEVHVGGTLAEATFKWSRENGSVVTDCRKQVGDEITVGSTGRDTVLGIQPGHWVELIDDTRELRSQPGLLLNVLDTQGDVIRFPPGAVNLADFPRNPKLRRWESGALSMQDVPAGGWFPLENGIEVQFVEGTYRTGDYWLIPARAFIGEFSGDIEWPREDGATGPPLALPPQGIEHHYCRLAVLRRTRRLFGARWEVLSDCRPLFPPLTELTRLVELCACDQEALPGRELPQPITVQVVNGQRLVAGAGVSFSIAEGGGSLRTDAGQGPSDFIKVKSDENGLAFCRWTLGPRYQSQRVTATLIDPAGRAIGPQACFTARQSLPALRALCGDGQEAMPGQPVPMPLTVAATLGAKPFQGTIRFTVKSGGGSLFDPVSKATERRPPRVTELSIPTGAEGMASCRWTLGPATQAQQCVEARLIDPDLQDENGNPVIVSVCFTATLSVAGQVAYDPGSCTHLTGVSNVEEALNRLCANIDLSYAGGGGQSGAPRTFLPFPLEVRVSNGRSPQPGATVLFRIVGDDGTGLLNSAPGDAGAVRNLNLPVDSDGIVRCYWRLDNGTPSQRVLAELSDGALPAATPVHFEANIVTTDEPGIVIERVTTVSGTDLANDSPLPLYKFLDGLRVHCSHEIADLFQLEGFSVLAPPKPNFHVTLFVPYRAGDYATPGFQPVVLAGTVKVEDNQRVIRWQLPDLTGNLSPKAWLENLFRQLTTSGTAYAYIIDRLLVVIRLQGNFIWGSQAPTLFLDGDAFGNPLRTSGRIDLALASGDGRKGGDFEMWFWLTGNLEIEAQAQQISPRTWRVTGTATVGRIRAAGVTVALFKDNSNQPMGSKTTDSQGNFLFDGLLLGPGTLRLRANNTDNLWASTSVVLLPFIQDPVPPLEDVRGIGPVALSRLQESGITQPDEVAALEPARLAEIVKMPEARAKNIIESARRLIAGEPEPPAGGGE